jgi:hypothetical protein
MGELGRGGGGKGRDPPGGYEGLCFMFGLGRNT